MDGAALDSLALERLLSLARELGVVLAIAEEADLTSFKVAQCIQAHLGLRQWPTVTAYAADHTVPTSPTLPTDDQVFASFARGQRGRRAVRR
ncbi:unnamed protein product [Lampetra planeri]